MPVNNQERMRELAISGATTILQELNLWSLDEVRAAIKHFDKQPTALDAGAAQCLRLYLGARVIGALKRKDT